MAQVTERALQMQCDTLNHIMGESLTPCTNHGGNNFEWHIGAFMVYPANGCVELQRIQTDGGGVEVIFDGRTKRELFDSISAYIDGYKAAECVAESDIHSVLKSTKQIGIIWGIDDITGTDEGANLSEDQAWEVLKTLDRNADCSQGINWDTVYATIEELYPSK